MMSVTDTIPPPSLPGSTRVVSGAARVLAHLAREPATPRQPTHVHWRRSSFSQGSDQTCVDVAFTGHDVLVRDSKDPQGPVLIFSTREWQVFLLGVHNHEFALPNP